MWLSSSSQKVSSEFLSLPSLTWLFRTCCWPDQVFSKNFLYKYSKWGGREVLLGHFTSNQGSSLAKDNHKGHLLCFSGLAQSFLSNVRKSLLKLNQLLSNFQSRINAFPFSGINPNILFLQPRSTKDHIMNNQFIGL